MTHSSELLETLQRFSTPTISNAIETFKVRLRNEGYMDASIINRIAQNQSMIGYAITMRMRTDAPPMRGLYYSDRNDWWEKLGNFARPSIIVMEDMSENPGKGSVAGEIHAAIFKALGCIGIITNGAVRDLNELAALHMHIYSGSISPSHAYAHIVDIGTPVQMGGMAINNGDLLHGDGHGITKVPQDIAKDIPTVAESILRHEKAITGLCASSDFSIEKLRRLLTPVNKPLEESK